MDTNKTSEFIVYSNPFYDSYTTELVYEYDEMILDYEFQFENSEEYVIERG